MDTYLLKILRVMEKTIRLIEGTFNAHDAAEILLNVLSDKINFHQVQLLSSQDKTTEEMEYSQKRYDNLRAAREEVTQMVRNAKANNQTLEIFSNIDIRIKS